MQYWSLILWKLLISDVLIEKIRQKLHLGLLYNHPQNSSPTITLDLNEKDAEESLSDIDDTNGIEQACSKK